MGWALQWVAWGVGHTCLSRSLRASLSVSLARSRSHAAVSSDSLIVRRPRFSGQWRLPGKERRQTRFILACLPIPSSIGWPISRAARPHDTSLFPAWRNPKAPSQQNSRLPNALSRCGIENKHTLQSNNNFRTDPEQTTTNLIRCLVRNFTRGVASSVRQIMLDLIQIMMLNMLTGKFRCLPSGNDLPIPPCVRGHWLKT